MIRKNVLVLIEDGVITSYCLDGESSWSVGRRTVENKPDISMHSRTISRQQGNFIQRNGYWFYVDGNGKNGTFYIHKKGQNPDFYVAEKIKNNGRRIRPLSLKDGDYFIFGAGDKAVINSKTALAAFFTKEFENGWNVVDTFYKDTIIFDDGNDSVAFYRPESGMIINSENGIGIYMGSSAYVTGTMTVRGE